MSEYQYYEFRSIHKPLTKDAREVFASLSSRAKIHSHSASYEYSYGDFRGEPEALLLDFADVFFYIANWGNVQLMFKYPVTQVDKTLLEKYSIMSDAINYIEREDQMIVVLDLQNEDGFGWTEGEGMLAELLPLYDEIKKGNYQVLRLAVALQAALYNYVDEDDDIEHLDTLLAQTTLSDAQKTLLGYMQLEARDMA